VNHIVDNLTLFDDDYMSRFFKNNILASELIISIILDRNDLSIIDIKSQEEIKNPLINGRDVILDIKAKSINGDLINIEVQRIKAKAPVERARFYSAMLDATMLKSGEDFKDIKESYVIFIVEEDMFEHGEPLYHIERYISELCIPFQDGNHIIYVNGEYEGDDDIGMLMRDFKCSKAEDMHYEVLKEGMKHYKEGNGRKEMCEVIESFAKRYAKDYAKEERKIGFKNGEISTLVNLTKEGVLTITEAAKRLNMTRDKFESYM
jgi:hypothetical protein